MSDINNLKKIKFNDVPINLTGRQIEIGNYAPYFRGISSDKLNEINITFFENKIKLITSFPSLDTDTCDLQLKEFNKEIFKSFSNDIVTIGISKDLPFTQKRYIDKNLITNLILLSDYKYSSFGINYGILIKELYLLARTAIIIDKQNIIRYIQIADELSNELDYSEIIQGLQEIINNPIIKAKQNSLIAKAGKGKNIPLSNEMIKDILSNESKWELIDGKKIDRNFNFKNFIEAKNFVDILSVIAEEQEHHPDICISYNKVNISLMTHSMNGLSDKDFILSKIINEIIY